MGPLTLGCFSIVNTTVLHIPEFVESSDVEPRIQRNQTSYMEGYLQAIHQFSTVQKVSAPNPIVQGSTVYYLEQPQSLKITFSVLKKKKIGLHAFVCFRFCFVFRIERTVLLEQLGLQAESLKKPSDLTFSSEK